MTMKTKVSPEKAARLLGIHRNTVYAWCQRCLAGDKSKLRNVYKNHANGYFYIDREEIDRIKDGKQ